MPRYVPPWQQKRPAPPPRDPQPTPGQVALAEMLEAEREQAPFGGWQGEMLPPPDRTPRPPAPQPLTIPAPPWSEHYRPELDPDTAAPVTEEQPSRYPPTTRTAA